MNNFIENFKNILTSKYAEFKGRANRKEYWYYMAVIIAINILFSILTNIVGGVEFLKWTVLIIQAIISLALLVPSLAISVRRMHDLGKSGGWIFINFLPFIGSIWFLILTLKEGDLEANRFG